MLKIFSIFFLLFGLTACGPKKIGKTARTHDAQERINSSKAGADEITKELDN